MSTPRTVIKSGTRPKSGLQHQPTKAPVKAPPPRAPRVRPHDATGQVGDGWVQQEEQS